MRKRFLSILFLIMIGLTICCPVCVSAAPLDVDASASLTLRYQKEEQVFPDLQVGIYRVAEAFPNGLFVLIEPFSSYPLNIQGITSQHQWQTVAETLCSYIVANQVQPDREGKTDEQGVVSFNDLETGLYFVRQVVAENQTGSYVFNQFMVYVPTPQSDGSYNYDVEARPKCTKFVPKTHYTVTKLWQDGGNQTARPKEVTVDIYKDGILQETQILSASNNWSYTWYVSVEDMGKWTVVERSVAESYKVTVQQNGSNFSIINTRQADPKPPQTGDTFAPLPWILVMCISGVLLLILGIYGRRQK